MATKEQERQLNGMVPVRLKCRLKQKLAGEDRTYSEWLRERIESYVAPKQRSEKTEVLS